MIEFFKKPWVRWLLVLLGLGIVGTIAVTVLHGRELSGVANIATGVFFGLGCLWGYFGFWKSRREPWAIWGSVSFTVSIGIWIAAVYLREINYEQSSWRAIGLWGVAAMMLGGIHLARLAVSYSHPVFAVARAVLDQANRMHLVKVAALLVVIQVVMLPTWPDPNERLDYRINFFLSWAMSISILKLGLMTVLLGCWTVSTDLAKRHIFMLASKPVGRFSYIAGKWIGLVLLNVVLLTVVGFGIWIGAMMMYAEEPTNRQEAHYKDLALREVLTARRKALPQFPDDVNQGKLIREHFDRLKTEVPDPDALPERVEDLSNDLLMQIHGRIVADWHKLKPSETQRYVFHGLEVITEKHRPYVDAMRRLRERHKQLIEAGKTEEARAVRAEAQQLEEPVTSLRLYIKPKYSQTPPDNIVRMGLIVGGASRGVRLPDIPNDTVHEEPLASYIAWIDDEGKLEVRLHHIPSGTPEDPFKGTLILKPEEGLALYYTAGAFHFNVMRAMLVQLICLSFLSMFCIAAATFVSFPVAVLAGAVVYVVASISHFFSESLDNYVALKLESPSQWDTIVGMLSAIWTNLISGEFGEVFKLFMSLIGQTVLFIVPSFNDYDPAEKVANGLSVSAGTLGEAFLYVGVVSTGVCTVLAWLAFRRKELARVMV